MLYYPSKQLYFDPEKNNYKAEDIFFEASDSTKLHGWYFNHRGKGAPKAVVVVFHGNAQNLTSHVRYDLWLLDHGFDLFIFDYRGYGLSEGAPSPEGTMQDGMAALRWLHENNEKLPIVVYGQSLGGAIALRSVIELKEEIPSIKLVIAESTFLSYRAVAAKVMSRSWLTWILQPFAYLVLSDKYSPKEKIKTLPPIPLLVIHGDEDPIVPYEMGQNLYDEAEKPKQFWKIDGGGHINAFFMDEGKHRESLISIVKKRLDEREFDNSW